MLFSVEQAFVGRDEKRAPLKNGCVGGYINPLSHFSLVSSSPL